MAAVAAVGALYFSNSTLIATNEQLGLAHRTAQTDQIKAAAEQLDSDKESVRLSGIYLIERLAQDSEADRPGLRRLLEAFVRTETASGSCGQYDPAVPALLQVLDAPTDIQAALDIIAKYSALPHPTPSVNLQSGCLSKIDLGKANLAEAVLVNANLTDTYLSGANLTETYGSYADFTRAALVSANLTGSGLTGANFTGAYLTNANLTYALLEGANLTDADLTYADLSGAGLHKANLTGADLSGANLTGAALSSADLTSAKLGSADLTGAYLTNANLTRIVYDDSTRWPDGFVPPPSTQS